MANTLIVRYNRFGDAIIPLSLISGLAREYNNESFTVLTAEKIRCFEQIMPDNVRFLSMISHRGGKGVFRGVKYALRRYKFFREMKSMIRTFNKVAFFQYGSFERKLHKYILDNNININVVIADESKFRSPERIRNRCNDGLTVIKVYKETLKNLGFSNVQSQLDMPRANLNNLFPQHLGIQADRILIGISPFSRLDTKVYPLDRMEKVVAYFASHPEKYQVLIFGGGDDEKRLAKKWTDKYNNTLSLINELTFPEEASVVSQCNIMLTLDSFNMHLASFLGTPVISIWGATVPQCGYYPEQEPLSNAIYRDLPCQPCSFYGENECYNKIKFECFDISPKYIIEKMENSLKI